MSRAPPSTRQQYGYGVNQNPAYYYEDTEGYVGDYSESDAPSDSSPAPLQVMAPADVTELYRRKPQQMRTLVANGREMYSQYMPQDYYYEQPVSQPVSQPQQSIIQAQPVHRIAPSSNTIAPIYHHKRLPVPPTSNQQIRYYTDEVAAYRHHQMMGQPNHPYYHSLTHVPVTRNGAPIHENPSSGATQAQAIRRHPVTVRTPRYVRRAATSGLYKRPSTLCLPIACQPDPAIYRRTRRVVAPQETGYQLPPQDVYATSPSSRHVGRRVSAPLPAHMQANRARKVESKKELNMTKSRLDAVLERYEKIFGKSADVKKTSEYGDVKDTEIYKHLKPRVPQSVKEKEANRNEANPVAHITKQQIPEIMETAETFEVEELTSEVLTELLSELTDNGLNDVPSSDNKRPTTVETTKRTNKSPRQEFSTLGNPSPKNVVAEKCEASQMIKSPRKPLSDAPQRTESKSYNYAEITQSMSKSNNMYTSESEDTRSQKTELSRIERKNQSKMTTSSSNKGTGSVIPRGHLVVDEAMELHRTKSYVVNLIDTALSNHFGTNVCEKNISSSSNNCMNPRCAMEILKNHLSDKMDKDLCLEIAQVLTDSFVSNSTAPSGIESKISSDCSCKSPQSDFVSQLKVMRWGHIRHIQREVRRLEDLERFLDSCSDVPQAEK